jgi:hypothetical protein
MQPALSSTGMGGVYCENYGIAPVTSHDGSNWKLGDSMRAGAGRIWDLTGQLLGLAGLKRFAPASPHQLTAQPAR